MERRITSLGKSNIAKMRNAFGLANINQIVEYCLDVPKARQYSDAVKGRALRILRDDYNATVDAINIAVDEANKQTAIRSAIQKNNEYFGKKVAQNENRKSSKIATFFRSFNKSVNMEKKMKYREDGLEGTTFISWERQVVDVYSIDVWADFESLRNIYKTRILPVLGNLYRKYKDGYVQMDLFGEWITQQEDGLRFPDEEPLKKISVVGDYLRPSNYATIYDEIMSAIKPPDTKSHFIVHRIDIKFLKPLVGGCYTCKGHGKNFKFNDLTLYNPYSTNNNCFFRLLEEYVDFKMTKTKCNEIRKEFGVAENEMLTMQDAYKIGKKYVAKSITFYTNAMDMLYGDEDGELKFFCMDNHYMSLVGKTEKCTKCGQIYTRGSHKCNGKVLTFYNRKIKRLIEAVKQKDSGLLNHKILHYDVETQYANKKKQHTPYIVGFCYYKEGKLIYDIFFGDDCMKEFYDFLGTEEMKHIHYINAYNGAGFDHYYLFREKLKTEAKMGNFILNNGNLLSAKIHGKNLIDLCRHLTGTLDSNLKQAGCSIAKGKIDHNLSVRWEETSEERKQAVKEYLKCDVLGLCELYEKVNEPIYSRYQINLCEKMTTSSNAFDIWRDWFLKDKIFLLDQEKDVNVRQAIYGARCYKNKNRFVSEQYEQAMKGELTYDQLLDFIFDADVVSLYPTAMRDQLFPVGKEKVTNIERKDKLGIYKIKYKAPKDLLNPILPRKEKKKLIWDLNDGEGWYSSVDIESARAKGYIIRVITGYYWEESAYIFRDYIDEFYQMKESAPKGTPAYTTAKLYLNGLYGKMLQRPNHSKSCIIKTAEEFWTLLNKNIIQEMSSVGTTWLIRYISKPEFMKSSGAEKPTQLGVFILAYSRKLMNAYYDKCGNTMNRLPFYYDTDSLNIHSSCLDQIKIDKSLGGIDDDVGGKVIKAIYIAPKTYAFQYVVSKSAIDKKMSDYFKANNKPFTKFEKLGEDLYLMYHFRGKGVQNDKLGWEDFERMDKGQSARFHRDFQMKKINMKKSGKQQGLEHFSHQHIPKEETGKTINQNLWRGRCFIDENNSVPYGFDMSTLQM